MWSPWVGILAVVGTLAMTPAVTPAQMGGGMGPPMGRGTWQRSDPATRKRETAPQKEGTGRQEADTTTQTSVPQPMAGLAASRPFYQQWIFLVVVGVGTAAIGVVTYLAARARRRRRLGPTDFVTEAVLVVDLVGSTHLATHYGDGLAMRARTILKDRTLAVAKGHGLVFVENTGDGYFMIFASVADAVRTALALLKDLRHRPPDLAPAPPLGVRAAITYGQILLDARGVRHGAVINKAFRLEGVAREEFIHVGGVGEREEIPDRNRILLDEEAGQEARSAGIPLACLGFCSVKGFTGLHRVYGVRW